MKDIAGYEGLYAATEDGKIWSYPKRQHRIKGGHFLKGRLSKNTGYLYICLCKDGEVLNARVHRIILQTFVQNPKNLPAVNHINGIKTDNRVENLEWISHSDNRKHAFRLGLCPKPTGGKKRSLCKRGHTFKGENILLLKKGRACRFCTNYRAREWRIKNREM